MEQIHEIIEARLLNTFGMPKRSDSCTKYDFVHLPSASDEILGDPANEQQ